MKWNTDLSLRASSCPLSFRIKIALLMSSLYGAPFGNPMLNLVSLKFWSNDSISQCRNAAYSFISARSKNAKSLPFMPFFTNSIPVLLSGISRVFSSSFMVAHMRSNGSIEESLKNCMRSLFFWRPYLTVICLESESMDLMRLSCCCSVRYAARFAVYAAVITKVQNQKKAIIVLIDVVCGEYSVPP